MVEVNRSDSLKGYIFVRLEGSDFVSGYSYVSIYLKEDELRKNLEENNGFIIAGDGHFVLVSRSIFSQIKELVKE